jgi:hypothetical protein
MEGLPPPRIEPAEFIKCMDENARYLLTLGASFFLADYYEFMRAYIKAWKDQSVGQATASSKVKHLRARMLLAALRGISTSVYASVYNIMTRSMRTIPLLITSLVVIFLTADGWHILGNGFTSRLIILWSVFIIAKRISRSSARYWGCGCWVTGC